MFSVIATKLNNFHELLILLLIRISSHILTMMFKLKCCFLTALALNFDKNFATFCKNFKAIMNYIYINMSSFSQAEAFSMCLD